MEVRLKQTREDLLHSSSLIASKLKHFPAWENLEIWACSSLLHFLNTRRENVLFKGTLCHPCQIVFYNKQQVKDGKKLESILISAKTPRWVIPAGITFELYELMSAWCKTQAQFKVSLSFYLCKSLSEHPLKNLLH